jgi:hypothetical protein
MVYKPTCNWGSWLVVWNMNFIFPIILGNGIIPTDFHIFQRGSNHQPGRKLWLSTGDNWTTWYNLLSPMKFPLNPGINWWHLDNWI